MTNALRNASATSSFSPLGVTKTQTRRHTTGTHLRSAVGMHPYEDFGLVCHECSTVTIFSSDASHPLACSRCGHGLRAPLTG